MSFISPSARDPFQPAHIRAQCLRNQHRSIGLLIVLNKREPRSPYSQSAAVQRVHKLALAFAGWLVADIRAARLKRIEVRARRDLTIKLLPRQPDLKIKCLRRRKY